MNLDDKGRCCGRKPLVYKNRDYGTDGFKFCARCNRAFDRHTGEQIQNWAYRLVGAGTCSDGTSMPGTFQRMVT